MSRYAIIDNGIVTNIVLSSADEIGVIAAGHDLAVGVDSLDQKPSIGWVFSLGEFHAPETAPPIHDVTPRQLRLALLANGITGDMIDAQLSSLDEPLKSQAQIEWQYSTMFHRHNSLVDMVATALSWTMQQTDDLWLYAATL